MSRIFVISDLHLGHKNILKFSGLYREGKTIQEHDDWIISQWNSVVTKRDYVWVLGDVAFNKEALDRVKELNGYKYLIMGNHDRWPIETYMPYFKIKPGIVRYKGFWLSHAPIHPAELRGKRNIHGHVHNKTIQTQWLLGWNVPDSRYINVCVEALYGRPLEFYSIFSTT